MKTISKGYSPSQDPSYYLLRKHPFRILKEGEKIDQPYPMAERRNVVSAVGYYNRRYDLNLVITYFPKGSPRYSKPHMIVGRPKPEKSIEFMMS